MNRRMMIYSALFLTALVLLRLAVLLPTADKQYVTTYRFGIMPRNDGADWVERAQELLAGRKIDIRPLFSIFLMPVIFLFGPGAPALVSAITALNILAVFAAFLLLKDIRNRFFIALLLSFFAVWRMRYLANVLTEGLASPLLIMAFAFVLRAFFRSSMRSLVWGYFLIGLAQAVRPWDFAVLLTLPLFPFFNKGFSKKTLTLSAILFTVIILPSLFEAPISGIFSTSEKASIDRAHHLYGQLSGGFGDNYWIFDRDIRRAAMELSGEKTARVVYERALENAGEDPGRAARAMVRAVPLYFRQLYYGFTDRFFHAWAVMPVFLILLLLLFDDPAEIYAPVPGTPRFRKAAAITAAAAFFIWNRIAFWLCLCGLGFIVLLFRAERTQAVFILLYFAGILLSLFPIGAGGVSRMWMSSELLTYYLAALGIAAVAFGETRPLSEKPAGDLSPDGFIFSKSLFFMVLALCAAFLILPLGLRALADSDGKSIDTPVSPRSIARELGISGPVVPPDTIRRMITLWPLPSFEKIDGNWVYLRFRYRRQKAMFLEANERVIDYGSQWHLVSYPYPRIAYDDRYSIIFPRVDGEKLLRFDGDEIIVVGKLIGKKRRRYTDKGFAVMAHYIGYPAGDKDVGWISLEDL